ncbi:exodeoxyribonuclease V subunit alpha [Gammaproteobacteria bacterium]|nr:exodeoxyribonuclease V subunit alpha [Gammaproteobacteria bacterium]
MKNSDESLITDFLIKLVEKKTGLRDLLFRKYVNLLFQGALDHHPCLSLANNPDDEQGLLSHPAVGGPTEKCPLIIFNRKLYFNKYFQLESSVARMIFNRVTMEKIEANLELRDTFDEVFGVHSSKQKLAGLMAITRKLTIISGGPGTGKTTTVVKILDIINRLEPNARISLAAPTGKAARRLREAINDYNLTNITTPEVSTVHRLLGAPISGEEWKFGKGNKLPFDIIMIDEASMIDLNLMYRLLNALEDQTRLILVGDPQQLPSVEAGSILSDLCSEGESFSEDFRKIAKGFVGEISSTKNSIFPDVICNLENIYRFKSASGIGKLANNLRTKAKNNIIIDNEVVFEFSGRENLSSLIKNYCEKNLDIFSCEEKREINFEENYNSSAIICSRRTGAMGSLKINQEIESLLEERGLKGSSNDFYHGRPIIITENDYRLGLFNGDTGYCLEDKATGNFLVKFAGLENKVAEMQLPSHESAFAITAHKSQGSEFNNVFFVLGLIDDVADNPNLINRELVYTAITRAKKNITIFSDQKTWDIATSRSSNRMSGMLEHLIDLNNQERPRENNDI